MPKNDPQFEVLLKFFLDFSNSWVSGSNTNITDTAATAAVALACIPFWDTNSPTPAGFVTASTSVYTLCHIQFFKRLFETNLVLNNNEKLIHTTTLP